MGNTNQYNKLQQSRHRFLILIGLEFFYMISEKLRGFEWVENLGQIG